MIILDRIEIDNSYPLLMTSIGGAPIHRGHARLIRECKLNPNTKLLVIVNSDEFLIRKHGYVFQDENDRAEIIDSFKDVDYTYIHHSNKQTIDDAILYFQPDYLCKGGDRSAPEFMPKCELDAAHEVGCQIRYGVGGTEKVNSSSILIRNAVEFYKDKPEI